MIRRVRDALRLKPGDERCEKDYAYRLTVPGQIEVPEAGSVFEAVPVVPGRVPAGYNPQHSFDAALLSKELTVRNWRPGDRFWPAHTKSPKKIKELLQEKHIAGPERQTWPVVVSGDEVVWLRGFPAPARLRPKDGSAQALVIRESPLQAGNDQ
jgi:tRNA(Ile)-lysidine synthase